MLAFTHKADTFRADSAVNFMFIADRAIRIITSAKSRLGARVSTARIAFWSKKHNKNIQYKQSRAIRKETKESNNRKRKGKNANLKVFVLVSQQPPSLQACAKDKANKADKTKKLILIEYVG